MKEVPAGACCKTLEMLSKAPLSITLFLVVGLSPAIFPIPQITYSTTSMCVDCKSILKWLRTFFSIKLLTCSVVPEAMFVRHHADSNWNFGIS